MSENKDIKIEHINLKVIGPDGTIVKFKIKKNAPIKKLMAAYCKRMGKAIQETLFRFDGQAIGEDDTPFSMEMEEDDTIEVYQRQIGGRSLLL